MALMPRWLPLHTLAVYMSGVAEVVLGLGILVPRCAVQTGAAYGLIALLVAVFPANVNMVFDRAVRDRVGATRAQALIRLPLQLVFVMWVVQLIPDQPCPQFK